MEYTTWQAMYGNGRLIGIQGHTILQARSAIHAVRPQEQNEYFAEVRGSAILSCLGQLIVANTPPIPATTMADSDAFVSNYHML